LRCLALADELRRRGARTLFLARHLLPALEALLRRRGHTIARLAGTSGGVPGRTEYEAWLGVPLAVDAVETTEALGAVGGVDWLVYDHYALDSSWSGPVRIHVKRLLAVDDLADRTHECDILLDQTPSRREEARYRSLVPATCRQLLGPRYALVRSEFSLARRTAGIRNGVIRSVLVALGAYPDAECLSMVLTGLSEMQIEPITVHVLGEAEISERHYHLSVRWHGFLDCPVPMLLSSDLAIGGGGSSAWERCCLGLPSVILELARNQTLMAEGLVECGAAVNLGPLSSVTAGEVSRVVEDLGRHPQRVHQISQRAFGLVDGQGASRVADAMGIIA
jgi:UDP-2,4-diacetamido-2,4,6-trideoxy-beta-L-altropyranose hydrolase